MTLFAQLALKFGSQPENLATEALGYILRAPQARRALLMAIGDAGEQLGDLTFSTQYATEEYGRPDLAGIECGVPKLLIEAKFWAGFTEHQPVGYLRQLPAGGVLMVIGPRVRLDHIMREMQFRLESAQVGVRLVARSDEIGRWAVDGRHLVVTSWSQVLSMIRHGLAGDPSARADVDQLLGLCERMDQEAFIPLTSEELSAGGYRRVHQLGLVVDDVTAELVKDGSLNTKGLRAAASNGVYGRYARLRGVNVYLHVSTLEWSQSGCPIWLTCYPEQWTAGDPQPLARCLEGATSPGTKLRLDQQGVPSVSLHLRAGQERHELVAHLAEEIRRIGELVAPLGSAAAGALPPPDQPEGERTF